MRQAEIHELKSMNYPVPERDILLRLGCHIHKARLTGRQAGELKSMMMKAFAMCRPQGRFALLTVESNDGRKIQCGNGFCVESADFAALAAGADKLWVAAATVGREIVDAVAAGCDDMASAAVGDAVASESTDKAMDFLQQYTMQILKKDGLALDKRRFSPGYGDMPLSTQQKIFSLLRLDELGMELTANYFLTPEKSVTALGAVRFQ